MEKQFKSQVVRIISELKEDSNGWVEWTDRSKVQWKIQERKLKFQYNKTSEQQIRQNALVSELSFHHHFCVVLVFSGIALHFG